MLAPSASHSHGALASTWRDALACAGLALALRLAYAAAVPPLQETPGLSRKYQACAERVLAGDGFFLQVGQAPVPYVDRLPGYVALLAGLLALGGTSTSALLVTHAALGALQAGAAVPLAARLGGARAGRLGGALVAGWPPLWKSDLQLVETGVSGLVMTGLVAVALGAGPHRRGSRVALLALLGLAAVLLRPDYLPIPLLVAARLAWEGGRRALPGIALALALPALACGAWAARNARVADAAFVSLGLGTNLLAAVGESVATAEPTLGDQAVARSEGHSGLYWPDPARRDRARIHRALALMRQHPERYAVGCLRRVAVSLSMHPGRLWPGPSAEESIKAWRAAHPGRPRYEGLFAAVASYAWARPLHALASLAWAPLALGGALWGAWRLRGRTKDLVTVLALPGLAVAVHVPLHAEPRYFMPFVPILLALAAAGVALRSLSAPAPDEA